MTLWRGGFHIKQKLWVKLVFHGDANMLSLSYQTRYNLRTHQCVCFSENLKVLREVAAMQIVSDRKRTKDQCTILNQFFPKGFKDADFVVTRKMPCPSICDGVMV